jgi:tetratricopeptide (TPR) repeat protein
MLFVVPLLVCSLLVDDPPSKLAAGDEAFIRMEYGAAVEFYASALDQHPEDPELLWRLARVYVCMGEVIEGEQRAELCRKAEAFAHRCILGDSTKAEGHTWRAAALGYVALDAGMGRQVELAHELLREVDRALSLNPEDDAAYSIRGSFFRAMGNVGWLQRQLAAIFVGKVPLGGFEEAEAALRKAIKLAPDIMRHHYELGILYIDMGRQGEAQKVLEHAATLPVKVAIDRPRLKKIQEILMQLSEQ